MDLPFGLEGFKFRISGIDFSLSLLGQRGNETIRQRHPSGGFDFSRYLRRFPVNRDNLNRQAQNLKAVFLPGRSSRFSFRHITNFRPVDGTDEEGLAGFQCSLQQSPDFFVSLFLIQKSQQSKTIENRAWQIYPPPVACPRPFP